MWAFSSIMLMVTAYIFADFFINEATTSVSVTPLLLALIPLALERFGVLINECNKAVVIQYIEAAMAATPYDNLHN